MVNIVLYIINKDPITWFTIIIKKLIGISNTKFDTRNPIFYCILLGWV